MVLIKIITFILMLVEDIFVWISGSLGLPIYVTLIFLALLWIFWNPIVNFMKALLGRFGL